MSKPRYIALWALTFAGGCAPTATNDPTPKADRAAAVAYKQVVVGNTQACALRKDNTVVCWGATEEEIEQGTLDFYYHDGKAPDGEFAAIFLSGGPRSGSPVNSASGKGCGLTFDRKTICCWGRMDNGRSGAQFCVPVLAASDGAEFTTLVSGVNHACGLDVTGLLTCVDDDGLSYAISNIREIAGNGYLLDAITNDTQYIQGTLDAHPCSTEQIFGDPAEPIPAKIDEPKLVKGVTGCFWNAARGLIRCEDPRLNWGPGPGIVDAAGLEDTTCAIYATGDVRCETPMYYDVDPEGIIDNWPPDPPGQFKQIALWPDSASVGCGITLDDELSCWGSPSGQARGIIERAP